MRVVKEDDRRRWAGVRPDPLAARDRKPRADAYERAFDLQALTPIYKGADNPNGIDRDYPFRGPALRGQLRAWWRATQETTSVDALRVREHALFGGVFEGDPRASRVSVGLSGMSSKPARKGQLRALSGGSYDYALWVDRNGDEELYHVDAKGEVLVRAAGLAGDRDLIDPDQLDRAVKAMVLLGGAGSRSRRGMGRLWSDTLFGATLSGIADLQKIVDGLSPSAARRDWPSLAGARVAWKRGKTFPKPGQAVDAALEDFKALRGMQSLGGRNFDGSQRMKRAQQDWLRVRNNQPPVKAFTAALGMPLMYRSTNGHLNGVTKVEPRHGDRLPSPVHLRPVPTNGGYAAVIIALQPWYRGEIEANNRAMGRHAGTLDPDAIDLLLDQGFATRGWDVTPRRGGA